MNKYFPKAKAQPSVHGFTLIEFLVATAVGLIIMAAVGATYMTSRRLNDVAMMRLSDQQDLRQVGINMVRDARMAGVFGCKALGSEINQTASLNFPAAASGPAIADGPIGFRQDNTRHDYGIKWENAAFLTAAVPAFQPTSNALIFQYGTGSASVSGMTVNGNNISQLTVNTNNGGEAVKDVMNRGGWLMVSSCRRLDAVQVAAAANASASDVFNLSLNPNLQLSQLSDPVQNGHIASQMAVMKYTVVAYAVGTMTGSGIATPALYRFELDAGGAWGNPQLLAQNVSGMAVLFGYADNCPASGVAATETFTFVNALRSGVNDLSPALVRVTLTTTPSVTAGSDATGQAGSYTIDANIRGGNICANRIPS